MPADRLAPTAPRQRVTAVEGRRHSGSRVDTAPQSRRHIRDLFGKIEQEFEKVYAENVTLRERLDQLTEKLAGVSMHQTDSSAALSAMASPSTTMASPSTTTAAEDGPKSAKKGSQLSQKLKSTYKTSTTKLANTFRISGCGRFVRSFVGHTDGVWEVSAGICHGMRILVTASADGTAKVWSADTGHLLLEYVGHNGSVNSVRLHPFKTMAVTASGDRTAHVWAIQPALLVQPVVAAVASSPPPAQRPLMSPSSSFAGLAALLSRRSQSLPNGDSLENATVALASSTISYADAAAIAATAAAKEDSFADRTVPSDEPDAGVLRRGDSLPCATSVLLSPSCIRSPLAVLSGHSDVVSAADWLCDGSRIITASWDGSAATHDVERSFTASGSGAASSVGGNVSSVVETLSGHDRELTNVCAHGSQMLVLTSSKDMSVRLWDLRLSSVAVNAFLGHTASVSSAVFAPHDRIVSGGDDRMVKLWDMRNMAAPYITIRGDSAVNRLSVCPNTGVVAVPHDNRHIRLFDGSTGARLGRMPRSSRLGHARMVCSTAWLDDAGLVATAGSLTTASSSSSRRNLACNLFSSGFDGRVLGWRTYTRAA